MPSGRVFHPQKYVGQVYGHLTVREFSHWKQTSAKFRHAMFMCDCDCGAACEASIYNLRSGNTASCGCVRRELARKQRTTHGLSHTPEFQIWMGMLSRCSHDPDYGGRGVFVCGEWKGPNGFEAFFAHVGQRPSSKHSVDRIDNNKGYEPGNVRWATSKQQARNKRNTRVVSVFGQRMMLADACEKFKANYYIVHSRIRGGWTVERALNLTEAA